MGMDVYGKKPTSTEGEYFRANVWYWHPLWSCCEELYPALAGKVKHGHDNSGDGLNKPDSLALAALLKRDIDNGVIAKYVKEYTEYIDSLPLEDCQYCEATGKRAWSSEHPAVSQAVKDDPNSVMNENSEYILECNSCKGTTKIKSFQTWYPMDLDLMIEFQKFLEHSGGFKIC
jgi:hypothetical protein